MADAEPEVIVSLGWLLTVGALIVEESGLRVAPGTWPLLRHAKPAPNLMAIGGGRHRMPTSASMRRFRAEYCDRLDHRHPDDAVDRCAFTVQALSCLVEAGYEFAPETPA